ncbi:MAG: hypothetical protein J1F35_06400 [Erysipelotrichales bacterium]|nr:hypothetical protein [Erysipelotrichales bacterium]
MKKLFFTFTIVAAGLMVSCGNKEMAAGTDSTNVADTTEVVDSVAAESNDTTEISADTTDNSVESEESAQ